MEYKDFQNSVAKGIKDTLNGYSIDDKKIVVDKLHFDDKKLTNLTSWGNIQKVKNRNGSLVIPIQADLSLKKGDKIISSVKKMNIGQLPVMTKNDSFLVDGIEYTVPLQLRRDAGIYTGQSANGTFVTSINSSKGRNYKVELEPESGKLKINLDGTKIPMLPILNHLGYDKNQIIKSWGNDDIAKRLYDINHTAADNANGRKALEKFYKKLDFSPKSGISDPEMVSFIKNYFSEKTGVNPNVTKITLGKPYDRLSPQVFLDISKKLVHVANNKTALDDNENLVFKHVVAPKDLIQEKITQDFKKKLTASLSRNLKNFTDIKDIVRPGLYTKSLKNFFNETKISEPSEQINPLHMISTRDKITLKGEGGITDEHTVSMDMKSLHQSYFGFIDPLHTPDGNAGLVNHLAVGAGINSDSKKLMNWFIDKKGKLHRLTVQDVYDKRIASPDQYMMRAGKAPIPRSNKIKVFFETKSETVPAAKVDFILAHGSMMFDPSTNLVPFINSSSGNRISMAGKMGEQSISIKEREAPLVSTITQIGKEFVKIIGDKISIVSPVNGLIVKITAKDITIQGPGKKLYKVELRDNLELNQESFYHDEPLVKVGDKVIKGQLLAKNNWTDNKGKLALGINARVGYFPYKGYNIEDGIVISDAFAKKLTSQHIHVEEINIKDGLNLAKFKLNFKKKYPDESFSKLDETGVVKNGSTVEKGNILVAYAKPFEFSEEDRILGKMMKSFKNRMMDQSIVWNYDFPGQVVDVNKSGNLIKVKVKSEQPAQITDKLSGRFGNKGVISNIIPTSLMPKTVDGLPLDVISNPHSVQSRINPSQLMEAALGKVAVKTNKPYLLENFKHDNNWQYVDDELKHNNVIVNEAVIDPETGKELKSWNPAKKEFEHPFVGVGYIQKLVHQTRKKFDARARGAYSTYDAPAKDPEASHYIGNSASKQNPKSVDRLTLYSLLAHGSKDVVNDMFVNKGQRRDDVWDSIINGTSLPPPKISTATEKGFAMMKAAGVNMSRKGRFLVLPPLTDKDTVELSSGKIPKPNLFLRGKDLVPYKGGMFDPILTGGTGNMDRYNHIELGTSIPNPITKNAIKSLLDLSDKDFSDVLKGTKSINGKTSNEYFQKALENIDIDKEIKRLEEYKKTAPKTKINNVNRKLRYLRALKSYGLVPKDYLISKLPVIPQKFRPILPLPNGTIEPAHINNLYRDTALAVGLVNDKNIPNFLRNESREELYNIISGLQGVTEPTINTQNSLSGKRGLRSVLTEFAGAGSPKGGFLHSKLLAKTQDYIGNSVIAIGPDLGLDEVGIPYKMAEIMYDPFLRKRLKQLGYKINDNDFNDIKKKNPKLITDILNEVAKERPVIINRNPSLHKGSTMAFNPVLIPGDSIKLNPLILKPFNADFDGDQTPVHVPISQKAVEQARQMVPSLNIFNPKNDSYHVNFDQEYIAGISLMTELGRKTTKQYKNITEAKTDYNKNQIRINDQIKINGKNTTLGREELQEIIPLEFNIKVDRRFDKSDLENIISKMITGGSVSRYTDVINKMKNFGAKYAYEEGFSFSLADMKPQIDTRAKYLTPDIADILGSKSDMDATKKIGTTARKTQKFLQEGFKKEHNRFFLPAQYGSRKISPDVMQQITVSPFFAAGIKDKLVRTPIGRSYSEGLDIHDNFLMSYGARKAIVDKVQSVAEPGMLSKELIASFSGVVITGQDCGTTEGVPVDVSDSFNLQNRILAKPCNGLKAGTILDGKMLNELKKGKAKIAIVRSPLTCKMPKGVCSICYGFNEHHRLPNIGDPIGIKAAQSIGETGTQSALGSHHLGGTVSAGSFRSGFELTKFLLHMPDKIKNKAMLSLVDGTVTGIEDWVNGHIIKIDKDPKPYLVRGILLVKKGDIVHKGQPLDSGPVKIQELADLVPMNKVQDHLTNELEKSFGGTKILRRNTETIIRSVTGYGKVVNPGNSPYLEEQVVPIHFINWIKNGGAIDTDDSIGWKLSKDVDKFKAGEVMTIDMANYLLDKKNIKKVEVDATGLEVRNTLTGINAIPLHQPDLIKKMSFQRIRAAMKEGPISGEYSNIHGVYPEPGLVMATEFGMPGYSYY